MTRKGKSNKGMDFIPKKLISKLTLWRILLYLSPSILIILFDISMLLATHAFDKFSNQLSFYLVQILLCLIVTPNMLLCYNYLKYGNSEIIIFDRSERSMRIENKIYSLKDIYKIEYFYSTVWFNAPWSAFRYSVLYLKDNHNIILTCLSIPQDKLELLFYNYKSIKEGNFFPLIDKSV